MGERDVSKLRKAVKPLLILGALIIGFFGVLFYILGELRENKR